MNARASLKLENFFINVEPKPLCVCTGEVLGANLRADQAKLVISLPNLPEVKVVNAVALESQLQRELNHARVVDR